MRAGQAEDAEDRYAGRERLYPKVVTVRARRPQSIDLWSPAYKVPSRLVVGMDTSDIAGPEWRVFRFDPGPDEIGCRREQQHEGRGLAQRKGRRLDVSAANP